MKERQIDAEIKKSIDARTKEFKEKISKLAYERIKKQLALPAEPLKGYPYNESIEEADSTSPNMAKAVQGLNDLGYKLKGRDGKDVQRVEKLFRSGNKKVLQGAMRALDTDIRDQIMDVLEPLGFVKNGVVESDDLDESIDEAKKLGSRVKIVKGRFAGKEGIIRQMDNGRFKGADKSFDIDLDDGNEANGVSGKDIKIVEAVAKNTTFSTQNKNRKPSLGQNKLSSAEYQRVKKLKSFNKDDWKWNGDLYIRVNESVKEDVDLEEGKMKEFHAMVKKGMTAEQIAKKIGLPVKDVADFMKDMDESVVIAEESKIEEELKVSDGLGAWITDFKDSDAPQFKDADEKKRRDMAIAAFVAAGGKLREDKERLKVSAMTEKSMTLKQIAQKYKGDIAKAQKSGNTDSLKKAEKELIAWAMDNNEIGNSKEASDWLDNVVADKDQFDALLKFNR